MLWDINELEKKPKTNKLTRIVFEKYNKVKQLEDSLPRDITFGGKKILRELTKLHNNGKSKEEIAEKTNLWKQSRILPFYILGEANQHGNRFFDFDFINNAIVFKPCKGKKIEVKYSCNLKYQKQLLKLKELIDDKKISVTIAVTAKRICVSFDDEIMSGYYIDKQERRKEVAAINKLELSKGEKTERIKLVYKKYNEELRKRKLVNKLPERYTSVDINPEFIGFCIADKGIDGIKVIIEKGVFVFTKLDEKLNLASDHPLQVAQNNKRVNEIQNAWKCLFEISNHYGSASFVYEDLDSIGKNEKLENREANRKTKNIWHRSITMWQIQKRCTLFGIEPIPIIPAYTSFIGNMIYDYFDATNAAIEICRKGMFKYTKGLFYPDITGTISDTMSRLVEEQNIQLNSRDVQMVKDCRKWNDLYQIAKNNGLRWRWGLEDVEKHFTTFSMNSMKSKVQIIRFYDYV